MYTMPLVAYSRDNSSFDQQSITNIRLTNGIIQNQNEVQQINDGIFIPNHPSIIELSNENNHTIKENGSKSTKHEKSSKKYSERISKVHTSSQDRKLSRQSSAETVPRAEPAALRPSRSVGDYIQRERKAHTMAPSAQISGPSVSPKAKMFAKPIAPTDSVRIKLHNSDRDLYNLTPVSYPKSDAEITDDDSPIIVKVRYDPDDGGPPSEDVVRKALDNQLKQQSNKRINKDPIIVNFFGQPTQPQTSPMPIRPQQPVFNRPMLQVQQPINRPSLQIPIPSQQQQQQLQQQQFLQQQQLQQQKLQLLQQKLQLLRQQQQLEQQELQLLQQRQQYAQQQKLYSVQQQQMLLQRPPPPPKQQQKIYSLQQQQMPLRKSPPQQQQLPHYPQIPLQKPSSHQQQLHHHHHHFPQQQQQIHNQQQQHIHNLQQQNPLLPPRGSRPSRPFLSVPPVYRPLQPFLQNIHIRPSQAPRPLVNQQQFRAIHVPRLPNRNISSAWTGGSFPAGLDTFRPINFGMATGQQSTTTHSSNTMNVQQNLPRRPNTAPTSAEVFRPPAVSDIPELSRENLLSMLNGIPDLQGRHFNIEYAPSGAPEGYPMPFSIDTAANSYPEPVVIDQLPSNVIQHVKSSNNPALAAALESSMQRDQQIRSEGQYPAPGPTLRTQPPTVMHHAAHPNQQVQQSRPVSSNDSDSSTEVSSSDTSSSEESEGAPSAQPSNNIPFVGPLPPTLNVPNQYR